MATVTRFGRWCDIDMSSGDPVSISQLPNNAIAVCLRAIQYVLGDRRAEDLYPRPKAHLSKRVFYSIRADLRNISNIHS